jgi:serine/threonine protein kinase
MSPQRREQIKSLFLAACALDEVKRSAFLDQACADDPEVRSEVESLLKHHITATIIQKSAESKEADGAPAAYPTSVAPSLPEPGVQSGTDAGNLQRFTSGTIVAERYRIVDLLGRGGMGEVYRADDMRLLRPVALKFLTHGRADDPVWLARFYNEARIALAVTHRNVCRVYDVGQAGGEAFISMEYIDGEDLASLLRRIGRLPLDKAVEIARQLCYGLAAAHSQGVLHRDLKPANIMVDGRGQARITDFGIAVLATPHRIRASLAGTPAYMAPELLGGASATTRSDLYSLGAVIYEMVSGQRASEPRGVLEPPEGGTSVPPSQWVEDLDPAFERLILQCLDPDPRVRPASALEVAAELPGGDPLVAVLAAGETPPPEIVAAGGRSARPRPAASILCASVAAVGLLAVLLLSDRTLLLSRLGLDNSPDVLEEKARQIISAFGSAQPPGRSRSGFVIDPAGLDFLNTRAPKPAPPLSLKDPETQPLFFKYQQQTPQDRPFGLLEELHGLDQPAPTIAESGICLDPSGRLRNYWLLSVAPVTSRPGPREPDWKTAFEMAGLDLASFKGVAPWRRPPVYADTHRTWEGVREGGSRSPLRVEAASVDGGIVYFRVLLPWEFESPWGGLAGNGARVQPMAGRVLAVLFVVTLLGALPLAWRNLRDGRGDRKGARRLAVFMFSVELFLWLVHHRPVADFSAEAGSLLTALRTAVFTAAAIWVYYIALEPYVRRFWPHSIISWSRLLAGQFRDPLVGRDILLGAAFGVAIVLLRQVHVLLASWTGLSPFVPIVPGNDYELGRLLGSLHTLDMTAHAVLAAVGRGMAAVMLMLLLRVVLRIPWLAGLAFFLVVASVYALGSESRPAFTWVTSMISSAAALAVLVYVGLLAAISSLFVTQMLLSNPMTADFSAWYAGSGGFALAVLATLLLISLYTSLAQRPTACAGPPRR